MGSKKSKAVTSKGADTGPAKPRTGMLEAGSVIPVDVMAYRRGRLAHILAAMARKGQRRPAASD